MVRPHAGHRMFMLPLYQLYRCGCDTPVLFVRGQEAAALYDRLRLLPLNEVHITNAVARLDH